MIPNPGTGKGASLCLTCVHCQLPLVSGGAQNQEEDNHHLSQIGLIFTGMLRLAFKESNSPPSYSLDSAYSFI